ncbi:hypothetical protein CDD82_1442 [Ophiocordyceps australis]|uniref:T6SS Phospholipase effector Tle1-like catalytic domain-containing protein n=1 Tax=Ophiocordyceps australis TaxID=1399860 RepID=A0A2C5YS71_9HYPO|nr:hypothetical protein CDD82_1442 [Ophiocordyceps australis]
MTTAGIGTYVISGSLSHTSIRARINSSYQKAKDSAIGSSFDQHVVGGYRFLMRFYTAGDEIYMFGFSRGAYIVRFLAEMLDHIGLLSHGNEEMVKFAWKAFAQWQSRQQGVQATGDQQDSKEAAQVRKMHEYMKGFRETFSRPVGRIRFLGLFDTVNSVPRFETAWMQRSKFPYTARTSAKVIRHAVSIDERRAKFRQDLIYQRPPSRKHHHGHHMEHMMGQIRRSIDASGLGTHSPWHRPTTPAVVDENKPSNLLSPEDGAPPTLLSPEDGGRARQRDANYVAPYRPRSRSRRRTPKQSRDEDEVSCMSGVSRPDECDDCDEDDEDGSSEQDIDEVWFAGGHGDVGGGWEALDDRKSASHVPLSWMIREAIKAGLNFDMEKVVQMGCLGEAVERFGRRQQKWPAMPDIRIQDENDGGQGEPFEEESGNRNAASDFHGSMHRAHTSCIHDSLVYGKGLGFMAVTAWKIMEWLPFRRMDLQADGTWKPIAWPLPRGEVRDIPPDVRVHGSVIRRLKEDKAYRPGNLIVGGGGRGVQRAPAKYGMGEWECVAERGDPVGEIWVRKSRSAEEVNGS